MRVLLLYNEPSPSRGDLVGDGAAVISVMESVFAIEKALACRGYNVSVLGLGPPLSRAAKALMREEQDLIFNQFEGFDACPATEWQLAEMLEALGCPFTGASAWTLALCLNKARAKDALSALGIRTPSFQVLSSGDIERFRLDLPAIVKPLEEDASNGLSLDSVVFDLPALAKQVRCVEEGYGSPVLVESFLPGREFNVAILGGGDPVVLPPTEIVYTSSSGPRILTYAAKWLSQDPAYWAATPVCPAQVSEAVGLEIRRLALAAHQAVGAPPYARVDLRADSQGRLHVLEVNSNPDLSPDAGMALQARAAGMEYGELIQAIVGLALREDRPGGSAVASYAP